MKIIELPPGTGRYLSAFLELPFRIYRDIPQWVPALETDIRHMLDRKRHPFYRDGEALFLLAINEADRPVGRVAVLNNHRYNDFNHEQTAFFYLFECIDNTDAARALFERACEWAVGQGLNKITGPKGFTTLDGMGLLVKGFEHRPAFGLPYNPSYYPALLENAGFCQGEEMVSGYLDPAKMVLPEKVKKVADLVQERRGIQVIRFHSRRELMKVLPQFQDLYNASLEGTTGNIPLTPEDFRAMANQLLWFADLRLIKILMKDGEMIGFLLAYPDISAAVQRCKGRLFPFGWLDLLLETRRTKWVNINGAAIVEKYRGLGGTAILFREMYESIREGGFEHADLVQVGTDNERMQLELRGLGIDFYKIHRLYKKEL
jgi:hypothetical protein